MCVSDKRDKSFLSPALCHGKSNFILMKGDGLWVSLGPVLYP